MTVPGDINPWSVTWRDYIDTIFRERQAALEVALAAQKEALRVASEALEKRLEKLNELRAEVTQDRSNFVTIDRFEGVQAAANTTHDAITTRIGALENFRSKATGIAVVLVLFAGVVGAAIAKAFSG